MESTTSAPALIVRRSYNASPQRVYEAWSDPKKLGQWFGPSGINRCEVDFDFTVGGAMRIEMFNDAGNSFVHEGSFLEIIEGEKIRYTSVSHCHGAKADGSPCETVVTVEFVEQDGGTELILTHEGLPDEASREGHQIGWDGSLDGLDELLGK